MKKIITIAILFFSFLSFAPIKVLETVPVERLGRVNNGFYIQKIGSEYTIFYTTLTNDDEVSSVKSFTFKNVNDDYANLYKIITNGFTANPLYDIKLELPNNFVWLHYNIVSSEKTTVQFMVSNKAASLTNASEPLTKDQVDKLFQKS
jgi:hypothetical protein